MSFDYPHTCPCIDKNITIFKNVAYQLIESLIEEYNPKLVETIKSSDLEMIINQEVDNFYSDVKSLFEDVRNSNSDIRSAAEYQLKEKEDLISYLEGQIE
jgi:hypothetical protein